MKKALFLLGVFVGVLICLLGGYLWNFHNYLVKNWNPYVTNVLIISLTFFCLVYMYLRNRSITNRCSEPVKPGMYLYSDGTIAPTILPNKTIAGIVVKTNGIRGFAIGLQATNLTFFQARLWCLFYMYDGIGFGKAYMGNREHLEALEWAKKEVNQAIAYLSNETNTPLSYVGGYTWAKDKTAYNVGQFARDLAAHGYTEAFTTTGINSTRCFINF